MQTTIAKPTGTRAPRHIPHNSKLIIDGQDLMGYSYTEDAEVCNISKTGISFYIKNRPWIEDRLEMTIYLTEANELDHLLGKKRRGRVVRTGTIEDDRQFVAARFE